MNHWNIHVPCTLISELSSSAIQHTFSPSFKTDEDTMHSPLVHNLYIVQNTQLQKNIHIVQIRDTYIDKQDITTGRRKH